MANVIRSHWYSWWIHRTTFASQNFFFLSFKSKVGTTLLTQLCMMNSLLIKYVKHLNTRIMSLNGVWALSLVFDIPLIIEVLVPGELEVIYLRVRDSCFFSTMDRCPIWVEHSPKYIRWWHPKSKNQKLLCLKSFRRGACRTACELVSTVRYTFEACFYLIHGKHESSIEFLCVSGIFSFHFNRSLNSFNHYLEYVFYTR